MKNEAHIRIYLRASTMTLIIALYICILAILFLRVVLVKQQKKVIMVVLGCAIEEIQDDRVFAALDYNEKVNSDSEVVWYLSGGVKNSVERNLEGSEASRMANKINSQNILLDETARNTAENFLHLREKIVGFPENSLEIVITTSEYHKERAETIFNGIFESTSHEAKWNLSRKACASCWNDEKIHMRNALKDVNNALLMLQNE